MAHTRLERAQADQPTANFDSDPEIGSWGHFLLRGHTRKKGKGHSPMIAIQMRRISNIGAIEPAWFLGMVNLKILNLD